MDNLMKRIITPADTHKNEKGIILDKFDFYK
jgi:hypothetical protein